MIPYIKYLILFFAVGFCFSSCENEKINAEFVHKLSSIENGMPSPYFNYDLYLELDDGSLIETNNVFLYKIYKDFHTNKYKDFDRYLEDLFNKKIKLKIAEVLKYKKEEYHRSITQIDKTVLKLDIEDIEKKYLEKEQNYFVLTPNKIDMSTIKTVLYRMFMNGYTITLNDSGGGYYNISK
jgi:hypothetical protein